MAEESSTSDSDPNKACGTYYRVTGTATYAGAFPVGAAAKTFEANFVTATFAAFTDMAASLKKSQIVVSLAPGSIVATFTMTVLSAQGQALLAGVNDQGTAATLAIDGVTPEMSTATGASVPNSRRGQCNDGVTNNDETATDCGGPDCCACPPETGVPCDFAGLFTVVDILSGTTGGTTGAVTTDYVPQDGSTGTRTAVSKTKAYGTEFDTCPSVAVQDACSKVKTAIQASMLEVGSNCGN
jgi:hypothetical protein